jgi:hypothetical protein
MMSKTPNFTSLQTLRELQHHASAETLTPALHGLCSRFGSVKKLAILTAKHEGAKQAICFLQLASEAQERALMNSLGVSKFGDEVIIVVDLEPTDQSLQDRSHSYLKTDNADRDMALRAA